MGKVETQLERMSTETWFGNAVLTQGDRNVWEGAARVWSLLWEQRLCGEPSGWAEVLWRQSWVCIPSLLPPPASTLSVWSWKPAWGLDEVVWWGRRSQRRCSEDMNSLPVPPGPPHRSFLSDPDEEPLLREIKWLAWQSWGYPHIFFVLYTSSSSRQLYTLCKCKEPGRLGCKAVWTLPSSWLHLVVLLYGLGWPKSSFSHNILWKNTVQIKAVD